MWNIGFEVGSSSDSVTLENDTASFIVLTSSSMPFLGLSVRDVGSQFDKSLLAFNWLLVNELVLLFLEFFGIVLVHRSRVIKIVRSSWWCWTHYLHVGG